MAPYYVGATFVRCSQTVISSAIVFGLFCNVNYQPIDLYTYTHNITQVRCAFVCTLNFCYTIPMEFYTYLHCSPDGVPFYVGKGCKQRAFNLLSSRNKDHRNIVSKHGAKNIGVFVFPCDSEDQALTDEVQQIAQLRNEGYELANYSNGGDGTRHGCASPESRRKMSLSRKRNNREYAKQLRWALRKSVTFVFRPKKIDNVNHREDSMRRYNVFLPEQVLSALRALSEETGLAVSDLIRRAIDEYIRRQKR